MNEIFPFSAVHRHRLARQALLCCLVHPHLRGVALSGPPGSGKSFLLSCFVGLAARCVPDAATIVRVPAHVDAAALLGGPDLERSLREGRLVHATGLLARARHGLLIAEDVALASAEVRAILKQFLDRRDPSARFLCTTTPEEKKLSLHLADAIPFLVGMERRGDPDDALALLRDRKRFEENPDGFHREHEEEEEALVERIRKARRDLFDVKLPDDLLRELLDRPGSSSMSGRTAVYAARAATAHAALRGNDTVDERDVAFALAAVVEPRHPEASREESPPPPPDPPPPSETPDDPPPESERTEEAEADEAPPPEQILEPTLDDREPDQFPFFVTKRGAASRAGGGRSGTTSDRGAHTRSVTRRTAHRRVSLSETLQHAAFRQTLHGSPSLPLRVRADDLRYKLFSRKQGILHILAVDASGSMARNRMQQAKGAVITLLETAYRTRDAVSLLAFRGDEAEILLPPTSAVEAAKRRLEILPTGGGTPLASALLLVAKLAADERRRRNREIRVLFLTDGRANVGRGGAPAAIPREAVLAELRELAARYAAEELSTVVLDTRADFDRRDDARELARWLGARYEKLPQPGAREVAALARSDRLPPTSSASSSP